MGALLKFLLFFFVLSWIIRNVLRFFIGGLSGSQQRTQQAQQQYYQQRQNEGKIHVDSTPKQKKPKSSDQFRGGEYVDYEEVD